MSKKEIGLKKKIFNFLVSSIKIIGLLAIFAGIGIFLAVGTRKSSPKRYAEEYFSYYVTNNIEEMYSMIDCQESEFVNLETFRNKCEGEKVYGSITGYEFNKAVRQGDKLVYVITYYTGSERKTNTYTITLNKQKKKTYLFFDTWKVSMDRHVIKDYKINVPVGTEVRLDGVDISKYKKGTSADGMVDNYVVDTILSGDHTVTVQLDATGEITKTQYVSDSNDVMVVATNDFAIKPDVQQSLFNSAAFILKTMYEYSMDRTKTSDDIAVFYAKTPEAQASAKATYENIKNGVQQENGASIRSLNIGTITPEIESFTYPDRVAVKLTFDYTFSAVSGTTMLSGLVSEFTGSGVDTVHVYLNQIDDDWKVVKVDMECVEYNQP